MKSKLLIATLVLAITSTTLLSVSASAQQDEIRADINFALHDPGVPIQDCNLGHAGCCNMAIPSESRSTIASQAVQFAKYGLCGQALALIIATQCHNPQQASVLANNPTAVCNELAQH